MKIFSDNPSDVELAEWLRTEVDDSVTKVALELLADGRAVWQWDPEVDGVLGLVHSENRRKAFMVIYDHGRDFECSDEIEDMAHS